MGAWILYGLIPVSCGPGLANASGADAKLPELQIGHHQQLE